MPKHGTDTADRTRALREVLAELRPKYRPGQFVFVTVPADERRVLSMAEATVVEDEGISAVVSKQTADELGLRYDYVAGWITLQVHSDLALVGLAAAVSAQLSAEGISSNVIAGRNHDHLLIPWERRDDAIAALMALAADAED